MMRQLFSALVAVAVMGMGSAFAESERGYTTRYKQASFEDVYFNLQNAIIDRGLVIDYTGHVNDMLMRTAEVSSTDSETKSPYRNAKFVQFCSSKLTHEAVRIAPQNLATCPYVIFVYQTNKRPNRVAVGYRNPDTGVTGPTREVVRKVEKLLQDIVADAVAD